MVLGAERDHHGRVLRTLGFVDGSGVGQRQPFQLAEAVYHVLPLEAHHQLGLPGFHRLQRESHGEAAASPEVSIVLGPVGHLVFLLRNVMTPSGVQLERQEGCSFRMKGSHPSLLLPEHIWSDDCCNKAPHGVTNCLVVEHCWDSVGLAIVDYAYRFERLAARASGRR